MAINQATANAIANCVVRVIAYGEYQDQHGYESTVEEIIANGGFESAVSPYFHVIKQGGNLDMSSGAYIILHLEEQRLISDRAEDLDWLMCHNNLNQFLEKGTKLTPECVKDNGTIDFDILINGFVQNIEVKVLNELNADHPETALMYLLGINGIQRYIKLYTELSMMVNSAISAKAARY